MDSSVNDYIDDTWFSASDTNGINSTKWVLIFLKIPSFQKMESFVLQIDNVSDYIQYIKFDFFNDF